VKALRRAMFAGAWPVMLLMLLAAKPVWAGELVMFERADCPICLRWNLEIAAIYPKTPESATAPLRRVTLGTDAGVALTGPVRYTPTFVLVADGRELGRIVGYQDDATFWGLLDVLLARVPVTASAR
jgi:hypothetical protein